MSLRRSARRPARESVSASPTISTLESKAPSRKKSKVNSKVAEAVEIPVDDIKGNEPTEIPVTPQKGGKKRKLADVNIAERRNEDGASKQVSYTPAAAANGLKEDDLSARVNNSTRKPRAVRPNQTNAPLVTPHGSRILAHPLETEQVSPSKSRITTDTILATAIAHLIAVDDTGKLRDLTNAHPCPVWSPEGLAEEIDPFMTLSTGIMAQQVSGAAASSIKKKFIGLFINDASNVDTKLSIKQFPTPAQVAATDITRLREAGLSQRKAEYIKGLAEKFESGELSAKILAECSDEEIMEKLIAVRGLGKWSVEMFATFGLKRLDFFSTGDLGVQRGMAAYVGRDVAKLKNKGSGNKWKYMSEKDMLDISAKFSPYRGLFMWYMWRIEDVDVSAIQDN